jgi:hypothetical protein
MRKEGKARRWHEHGESYKVNIISFSLTLVHYATAMLASLSNTKAEGMSGELHIFIKNEQVKLERRQSQRSRAFTRHFLPGNEHVTCM